jgi:hypothetical protein
MSILKKFLKNKKGGFVVQDEIQNLSDKIILNNEIDITSHNKSVLEDGRLYDTSKAEKVFSDPTSVNYICFSRSRCRAYFLTKNGRWFSADEDTERVSGKISEGKRICIRDIKVFTTYKNLRIELESTVKILIGKNDYELYKKYFGEVEEA